MKKCLEVGYNNRIYKELILLVAIMIVMCLAGCASMIEEKRDSNYTLETLENMEEPLVVLYDPSAYYLLQSFKEAHTDIKIKQVVCDFNEDNKDLESIISKNGVPDLILGDRYSTAYLEDWYNKGYITDLGYYYTNDTNLNTEDYFPQTFEVLAKENCTYALPLGISMDCIITTESKYLNSSFVNLGEDYTGRELMSVLMEEIEKVKENGEYFCGEGISPLEAMYWLDGISQTSEGIEIDEELYSQWYEILYSSLKEANEAKDYWHEQGKQYGSDYGYAWPSALEPRLYEGKFNASIWVEWDAPAMALSYAETANQYYVEEGIKAFYLPTADDGNKYKARVEILGAICEESNRKELAYELLRALMDEEINSFGTLSGSMPQGMPIRAIHVYPINKENALSFLERFENQNVNLIYGQTQIGKHVIMLERKDISEAEKEKHQKMLNGISGLYYVNEGMHQFNDMFWDYYDADISDYQYCYLETMKVLNGNSVNGESESDVALTENSLNLNDSSDQNEEKSEVVEVEKEVSSEAISLKEEIRNTEVGETFFFGETEQDGNLENGAEPIEWIILEKNEDKAFVISKKILEWLTFSKYDGETEKDVYTWDLKRNQQRKWLTNELYQNGLLEYEKEVILLTHSKDGILTYDEYDDYLYIPSREEVEKYMPDVNLRKAEMTAYAAEKANLEDGEFGRWTLRSMAMTTIEWDNRKYTRQINEEGEFGLMYTNVPNGVRPVMWLDIS